MPWIAVTCPSAEKCCRRKGEHHRTSQRVCCSAHFSCTRRSRQARFASQQTDFVGVSHPTNGVVDAQLDGLLGSNHHQSGEEACKQHESNCCNEPDWRWLWREWDKQGTNTSAEPPARKRGAANPSQTGCIQAAAPRVDPGGGAAAAAAAGASRSAFTDAAQWATGAALAGDKLHPGTLGSLTQQLVALNRCSWRPTQSQLAPPRAPRPLLPNPSHGQQGPSQGRRFTGRREQNAPDGQPTLPMPKHQRCQAPARPLPTGPSQPAARRPSRGRVRGLAQARFSPRYRRAAPPSAIARLAAPTTPKAARTETTQWQAPGSANGRQASLPPAANRGGGAQSSAKPCPGTPLSRSQGHNRPSSYSRASTMHSRQHSSAQAAAPSEEACIRLLIVSRGNTMAVPRTPENAPLATLSATGSCGGNARSSLRQGAVESTCHGTATSGRDADCEAVEPCRSQ